MNCNVRMVGAAVVRSRPRPGAGPAGHRWASRPAQLVRAADRTTLAFPSAINRNLEHGAAAPALPCTISRNPPGAMGALLGHAAPVLSSQDAVHPAAQHADLALQAGPGRGSMLWGLGTAQRACPGVTGHTGVAQLETMVPARRTEREAGSPAPRCRAAATGAPACPTAQAAGRRCQSTPPEAAPPAPWLPGWPPVRSWSAR